VGTNEALVGVLGIVGPFLGGWSVDLFDMRVPFVACAVLVVAAVVFQAWTHRRGFLQTAEVRID
jgi:predicted MFS family arabinose efflux permease